MNATFHSEFPRSNAKIDGNLFKGGVFLGCELGMASYIIWGVGLLASGQTAMIIGTHASKYVIEGFLNVNWAHWKRVLATRLIVIIPICLVARFADIDTLTRINVILNVVKSFQLPFAIIPAITFTSSVFIMGKFANHISVRILMILLLVIICITNMIFVALKLTTFDPEWIAPIGESLI